MTKPQFGQWWRLENDELVSRVAMRWRLRSLGWMEQAFTPRQQEVG